ncbi:META domain-containing protein [Nocardioides humilatus]|uniref:META domain-containing protein n=1 Tax=Nocardioides humilatus TaxID=2607660 RepID=A0A5B1L5E7_9ACTN|nr:META domain-containing protein [Nocardioides humilatus]KAA1415911.1 META domain-containing protein [Nocardioides humilatus]
MTRRPTPVKTISLAAAALLVLTLAGCGDEDSSPEAHDDPASTGLTLDDLDGNGYATAQVSGHMLVDETVVRLGFDGTQIAVDAGCNHLFGTLALDGDTLDVSNMGGTEIGCEQDRADQDAWIVDFLTSGPTIALDGDTLTLTAGDVSMALALQAPTDVSSGDPDDTVTSNE